MTNEVFQFIGFDWTHLQSPALRLLSVEARTCQLVPLTGLIFGFQVVDTKRHCCGWFDLTGVQSEFVPCAKSEIVESGTQCPTCKAREGFLSVHHAHDVRALPKNVSNYIGRPHRVYLDVFADGTVKVGTIAESRLDVRLAEQGAFAANYVAWTSDGIWARELEDALSSNLNLKQSMSGRSKLKALESNLEASTIHASLDRASGLAQTFLRSHYKANDDVKIYDSPKEWLPPECSASAFRSCPAVLYPFAVTEGEHSFRVVGVTGSILVAHESEDDGFAQAMAVDLSALRGHRITLGDYAQREIKYQATLF